MHTHKINRTVIIIPGARKSGTTTLFEMLSKHAAIRVPRIREPAFFAFEKNIVDQYTNAYERLFAKGEGDILLDASTYYFMSQRAPRLIREYIHNPKIIIILRDPAKRAYSSFLHNCKLVPQPEKRSFDSILENVEGPTEEKIISSENRYIQESIKNGLIDPDYPDLTTFGRPYQVGFEINIEDKQWIYKYFQQSLYRRHIMRFRDKLGDNVFVVFFEKLIRDPKTVMTELFRFIGIEPEPQSFVVPHANITRIPRNSFAKFIHRLRGKSGAVETSVNWLKSLPLPWIRKFAIKQLYRTPKITADQYLKAKTILQEEYSFWFQLYPELRELWRF